MGKIVALTLVLVAGLAATTSAEARGGCGLGYHRGFLNGCYRNAVPPPVVVAPVVVAPAGGVVVTAPAGVCPAGYHLGPYRRHCIPN